mmetsp:Transcript_40754/g.80491  ORF Transcript_40754/g.80491 Transcript_40754/m.80491 type:complete len:87 (+) Transcript_40754:29-289(+)
MVCDSNPSLWKRLHIEGHVIKGTSPPAQPATATQMIEPASVSIATIPLTEMQAMRGQVSGFEMLVRAEVRIMPAAVRALASPEWSA